MFGSTLDMMGTGVPAPAARAMRGSMQLAQTALGSTQGTAFAIGVNITEFSTVAASTGAILPNGPRQYRGDTYLVANQGANALSVYPPVGFAIGLTATKGAASGPSGQTAIFSARGDGTYFATLSA